jgi:hypothetical protein
MDAPTIQRAGIEGLIPLLIVVGTIVAQIVKAVKTAKEMQRNRPGAGESPEPATRPQQTAPPPVRDAQREIEEFLRRLAGEPPTEAVPTPRPAAPPPAPAAPASSAPPPLPQRPGAPASARPRSASAPRRRAAPPRKPAAAPPLQPATQLRPRPAAPPAATARPAPAPVVRSAPVSEPVAAATSTPIAAPSRALGDSRVRLDAWRKELRRMLAAPATLRHAIVAQEILGAPLGLRRPVSGYGGGITAPR